MFMENSEDVTRLLSRLNLCDTRFMSAFAIVDVPRVLVIVSWLLTMFPFLRR
jgi:hypothetical protein